VALIAVAPLGAALLGRWLAREDDWIVRVAVGAICVQAAGCLLPACCLLPAACWLAAGCCLLVAGCWLLVAGCWLPAAGWLRAAALGAAMLAISRVDAFSPR